MKLIKSLCFVLAIAPTAVLAEKTITMSYENVDSFPWAMVDGSGIDMILLKHGR